MSKKRWWTQKFQDEYKIVMFSTWNSLLVKNLNYKFSAYQTMIKYFRENDSKALKH